MDNYTSVPYDDYDVLIEGDLPNNDREHCDKYDATFLSAQLVPKLYFTVFVVCLLDNFLVVLILVKYKGLRYVENIYFLNLAISNLLFSLILPFWAYTASHGEVFGNPVCKIFIGIYNVGLYSEACFNVLLTVCRFLVSYAPTTSLVRKVPCGIFFNVLMWAVAILATLPEYVFQLEGKEDTCSFSRPHFLPTHETSWKKFLILKMNILGLLLPLFVFIICYVPMIKVLCIRKRTYDPFKLIFAIMVVFLLMWAPYNIALFLTTFKEHFSLSDCQSLYGLERVVQITKIIAPTHCCINPLLHVIFDQDFRSCLCCMLHLNHNTAQHPRERSEQNPLQDQQEQEHSTAV
ncbi:PREDICTED: c-C chemokine receptor-like 2 [Chrysochloris asiatica]|uniref:C-C chemokine receptor-like 2 n=1 Tax=Chrysochloris asiatica TaxID=185453 RepID=A0A9B0TYB4_CHRAS|nr:PREDICTED: c-C chemokine receptor-like 2 [Chrysochloris asiatica]